jgi:hypothetical protein
MIASVTYIPTSGVSNTARSRWAPAGGDTDDDGGRVVDASSIGTPVAPSPPSARSPLTFSLRQKTQRKGCDTWQSVRSSPISSCRAIGLRR